MNIIHTLKISFISMVLTGCVSRWENGDIEKIDIAVREINDEYTLLFNVKTISINSAIYPTVRKVRESGDILIIEIIEGNIHLSNYSNGISVKNRSVLHVILQNEKNELEYIRKIIIDRFEENILLAK